MHDRVEAPDARSSGDGNFHESVNNLVFKRVAVPSRR